MWAIIPCKRRELSKQRLSSILSPDERVALVEAMFTDVLGAVTHTAEIEGTIVTSSDPRVQSIATEYGVQCINRHSDAGLSVALTFASNFLSGTAARGILVVASDLPLCSPEALSSTLRAMPNFDSIAAVPAIIDSGTNVLAMKPNGIVPFSFGANSFQHHIDAAQERAVFTVVVERDDLGLDIDRPNDLRTFMSVPSNTKSYRYLDGAGIRSRLLSTASDKAGGGEGNLGGEA